MNSIKISMIFNLLGVIGIGLIVLISLGFQFFAHELPCPLCILQRLGLLFMAYSLMLDLSFGFKPSHYALAIISALVCILFAARQILLHIVPGTGAYGNPILGLHLYTWTLILCVGFIIYIAGILITAPHQFNHQDVKISPFVKKIISAVSIFIILLTLINGVAVFFECGLTACPSDPQTYLW